MDERLKRAIAAPRIQQQAGELVALALQALADLKRLDESLYEEFVASRRQPAPEAGAESLRRLWELTFAGLLDLLAYCRVLGSDAPSLADATVLSTSFDWAELEGGSTETVATADLNLGSSDIGDLLENIDEHVEEGDPERWAKVLAKVASIEYGLRSQHTDATARLAVALGTGKPNQALGLLDDTQSSASEGVHAIVAAVYEELVPDVDPSTVVPGYLTSLSRALLVRGGLAELATSLAPANAVLQAAEPEPQEATLISLRATMRAFIGSAVCKAMRAADRWQMVEFEQQLADQPFASARLTSEGLAKYLEGLAMVNQREVLLLHDQRTIEELREALATARQLADISPRTAQGMIDRAYQAAQTLRGRHPRTDALIAALDRYAIGPLTATQSLTFLEPLEAVLEAASS